MPPELNSLIPLALCLTMGYWVAAQLKCLPPQKPVHRSKGKTVFVGALTILAIGGIAVVLCSLVLRLPVSNAALWASTGVFAASAGLLSAVIRGERR